MSKKVKRYKWADVGTREYLELTTASMQYHWRADARWLDSARGVVGSKNCPWLAEIKIRGKWLYVGAFHTGRQAKAAGMMVYYQCVLNEPHG